MKRYLNSFILSTIIYSCVFASMYYFLSDVEFSKKETKLNKESRIAVSLLAMTSPKLIKTPPKKLEKKPCKTEVKKPKKQIKPKPKKIIKKKSIKKKEVVVQKKEPIKQVEIVKASIVKSQILVAKKCAEDIEKEKLKKEKEEAELLKKQNIFFAQLREAINSNKTYPKTARRRNVQGEVKVKFSILANGNVEEIKVIKGHSIFKRSVHEAIQNSFPISVKKTLFTFPKEFQLTLNYILN